MINIRNYIFIATLILESSLFILYDLSPIYIFFFFLTVFEAIIFSEKGASLSVAGWWLYVYLTCSFLVVACFKFTPSRFTLGTSRIDNNSFVALAQVSVMIMFFYFMALLVFCKKRNKCIETYWTNYAPRFNVTVVFIVGFFLTFISQLVGIGKMGEENTRLPFHLAGVIQFVRTDLIPVMALCAYANRKKTGKSTYKVIVFLFVWSLYETIVRLSKSAIIFSFLPIIMYELLSDQKNIKRMFKEFAPVLMVVLILYPVIETMRHADVRNAWDESEEEISGTFSNPNTNNYIVKPFNRTFLTGFLFASDESTIDHNSLFDFHQAPLVVMAGGAPRYQTFMIDGYPEGVAHSSGTSPFIDSFLMGGYGLLYISVFIMVLLADLIDRRLLEKSNYVIVAILYVAYYRLFDMPIFTSFLNEMSIRYVIVYAGICFYIIYKFKTNNKTTKYQ